MKVLVFFLKKHEATSALIGGNKESVIWFI